MRRAFEAAIVAAVTASVASPVAAAVEFGDRTSFYEDDAWYDITEWFDGNDYNPTDESWWRWDDETYQAAQDTGADVDSDGWFGYTGNANDDWYYDYYDPDSWAFADWTNDGSYEFASRFYDYDQDGAYDAYATFADRDGDGAFDRYNYYSFNQAGADGNDQGTPASGGSRQTTVTGRVQRIKVVQVRGGEQHVVAAIQPKAGSKQSTVLADLGRRDRLKSGVDLGQTITVRGPTAVVGGKSIVLARSLEKNGVTSKIEREPRTITGKVVSTHRAKVRGVEHLLAMVDAKQDDRTKRLAVDLGPADRLGTEVAKGKSLTFSGVPVKVNDKPLVIAQTVWKNGSAVPIDRGAARERGEASAKRE